MPVTVDDINNKEFTRKLRGYNEIEVDDFLDEIVKEYAARIAYINELESQLKSVNEQLSYMKSLEMTLRDTLVTAQRSADETIANAQRKADTIISNAEEQSKLIVVRAKDEVIRARTDVDSIRQQMIVYKASFKKLVEAQLQFFEDPLFSLNEEEDDNA